jgi:transketolase
MTMINHLADARSVEPYGYDDLFRFMSMMTGDEKHSDAATSTLDAIWTLYDRVLHVDPLDLDHPNRDRFYLSKGHGPMAFYAVLAAKGFLDPALLPEFATSTSILGHHPDRRRVPGVEISSGSLGQGLALGVGASLAIGLSRRTGRVFVLVGDGELDEGSNHEAIALAGRLGIGRLTAIVIDNDSSYHGWPGGIETRFSVEGWQTAVVDGRDHDAMFNAFTVAHRDRPLAVVARVGRKA